MAGTNGGVGGYWFSQGESRDGDCSGDDGEDCSPGVVVVVMVIVKVALSVVVKVKTVVQGSWW